MKSPSMPGALRHHRARREAMKRAITAPWRNRVRLGDYCPIDRSRSVA